MSITYTWFIDQIKINQNLKPNFVTEVSWGLRATDEIKKAVVQSNLNFEQLSSVFVPYESLTEEIVIKWVQEKLGNQMIESYKDSLKLQIESSVETVKTSQAVTLPWIN
jgi:hypothetical protein